MRHDASSSRTGLAVYIVFPPIHALLLEGMRQADAIDDYYALIRTVVEELGGEENVQVWDMSAYFPLQQEAVPTDCRTPMTNYADPSHFTTAVGDCALAAIVGPGDAPEACLGLGSRLTPENVESYLSDFEDKRGEYCQVNAADCGWVRDLYLESGAK